MVVPRAASVALARTESQGIPTPPPPPFAAPAPAAAKSAPPAALEPLAQYVADHPKSRLNDKRSRGCSGWIVRDDTLARPAPAELLDERASNTAGSEGTSGAAPEIKLKLVQT